MADGKSSGSKSKSRLIVCDEKEPSIKVKAGMRFEVTSVTVVDAQLKETSKIAARLCGGTTTCLALTEV